MSELFTNLPEQHAPLDLDGAAFLARLPTGDCEQEVGQQDESVCRRMEGLGYAKVSRHKADPIAHRPTWYASVTKAGRVALAEVDEAFPDYRCDPANWPQYL